MQVITEVPLDTSPAMAQAAQATDAPKTAPKTAPKAGAADAACPPPASSLAMPPLMRVIQARRHMYMHVCM